MENTVKQLHLEIKTDIQNQNNKQVIEKYQKIINLKPLNVNDYLQEFGTFYENQELLYKAIECYIKIIKSNIN